MSTTENPRTHISLNVSDIGKTVDFYRSFFGQEPVKIKPRYAKFELLDPALVISFVENPTGVVSGFGHLGIQVATEDELKMKFEIATRNKLKTDEEYGTKCCYALQDKFWVTDPDAYRWEVYQFIADTEDNDPEYAMAEEGCCGSTAENPCC